MKTNENAIRLRPLYLILSIALMSAWINTTVFAAEGSGSSENRRSKPIRQVLIEATLVEVSANPGSMEKAFNKVPGSGQPTDGALDSRDFRDFPNASSFGNRSPSGYGQLSHEMFMARLSMLYVMGLGSFIPYPIWNHPIYRDTLRATGNPLAGTALTGNGVSQPEHVRVMQWKLLHYMIYGPLLMEVLGLNYGYTDPSLAASLHSQGTIAPMRLAMIRLIIYAMMTYRPPHVVAAAIYLNTGSILLAAEAIALTYTMYNLVVWGGVPPSAQLQQVVITAALINMWYVIMNPLYALPSGLAIHPRQASLAMSSIVLLLSWNVLQAQTVAMQVLNMFVHATIADRRYVSGVLGVIAVRQFVGRDGQVRTQVDYAFLFTPRKGVKPISLWEQVSLFPIIAFFEVLRFFMGPVEPNDPLYLKEGSGNKASAGLRKGLGFILGAVGAPVQMEDKVANDQWGLHAVGFKPRGTPGSAWDIADGSEKNVVVAVIDSGLDTAHPDGPQYLWVNEDEIPDNGIDDDANGYVDDVNGWNFVGENNDFRDDFGHGTFVSGIIAAKRNNGEGIAGINPGAQIMTLKVLNERGTSKSIGVYRAIRYAVDNGARVLNLSLGGRGLSPLEQIGINYAYTMGCIVVVAAGNQGGQIAEFGPPGARRAFSVASMNMDSSRRNASNKGLNVALAAPGESVYSLTAKFEGKRDQRVVPLLAKDYHRLNGTSFAAPFVAATAALIWTKHPHLDHRKVEDMILATAQDIHDPGWDTPTGQGKLDAFAALNQDPDKVLVPRITEFFVNKVKRRIASVDLYGVVRGDVKDYIVEVGRGTKPKEWQRVYGPATVSVDHDLICRIDGQYFSKGSKWKVRVIATGNSGQSKTHEVLVAKK